MCTCNLLAHIYSICQIDAHSADILYIPNAAGITCSHWYLYQLWDERTRSHGLLPPHLINLYFSPNFIVAFGSKDRYVFMSNFFLWRGITIRIWCVLDVHLSAIFIAICGKLLVSCALWERNNWIVSNYMLVRMYKWLHFEMLAIVVIWLLHKNVLVIGYNMSCMNRSWCCCNEHLAKMLFSIWLKLVHRIR